MKNVRQADYKINEAVDSFGVAYGLYTVYCRWVRTEVCSKWAVQRRRTHARRVRCDMSAKDSTVYRRPWVMSNVRLLRPKRPIGRWFCCSCPHWPMIPGHHAGFFHLALGCTAFEVSRVKAYNIHCLTGLNQDGRVDQTPRVWIENITMHSLNCRAYTVVNRKSLETDERWEK